ncbi:hypothetical protein ACIPLC_35590 [Kitasatospora sp. NPDC086801]|uniref:hypothetical protein n=1 Tax=Kitasatospora sp. NPDC086801 TaxID=3364066 RepID=UPI0038182DD5
MTHGQEHEIAAQDGEPQTRWSEEITLQTVEPNGVARQVTVYLGQPSKAVIALLDSDSRTEISGSDYLDCLMQARMLLERQDRRLCCQGARPNVHPSGQLRQFTNGRMAYIRPLDPGSATSQTVDIFAPALPNEVVTLSNQREALMAAWNARHPNNQI